MGRRPHGRHLRNPPGSDRLSAALPVDLTAGDPQALPSALRSLHGSLTPGDWVTLRLPRLGTGVPTPSDLVEGAGFVPGNARRNGGAVVLTAQACATLADLVRPGLGVLICGLNPSLHAARTGVPYCGPNNRFWPAARAGGLVETEREVDAALAHGVGFTDVVKRATSRADEVTAAEFRAGFGRVERLVGWLAPAVVCFVGLGGYRTARDRHAVAGWQPHRIGGAAVYLMPSTSGLNAATSLDVLTTHFSAVAERAGFGKLTRPALRP